MEHIRIGQPLLKLDEASALLNIHPETLRRIVGRGEIAHVRISNRIAFTQEMISDYLNDAIVQRKAVRPLRLRKRDK